MSAARRMLALGLLGVLSGGCGSDQDCTVPQGGDCSPLYAPTYENVYANTLKPTCGQAGTACHATEGAQGGFKIGELESTYDELLQKQLINPGEPGCSPVVQRLETDDPTQLMPPGARLSAPELCAIETWIANGASR
jgi:hypothetical protein